MGTFVQPWTVTLRSLSATVSTSGTNFVHNQFDFHTLLISSIGRFFVSGRKKAIKTVMLSTKPAKKRPNFKWQSMLRKTWATANVNNIFTATLIAWPQLLAQPSKLLGRTSLLGLIPTPLILQRPFDLLCEWWVDEWSLSPYSNDDDSKQT